MSTGEHESYGNQQRILDFRCDEKCFRPALSRWSAFPRSARAQQPTKIARIGYLTSAGPSPSQMLLQGLRELGYVAGQNIAIDYRSADLASAIGRRELRSRAGA